MGKNATSPIHASAEDGARQRMMMRRDMKMAIDQWMVNVMR